MIYQLIFEATLFLLYYYYSLLLQFIRERIRIIFRLRTSLHIRLAAHIKPQGTAIQQIAMRQIIPGIIHAVHLERLIYMFSGELSGASIVRDLPFSKWRVALRNRGAPNTYSSVPGQTG